MTYTVATPVSGPLEVHRDGCPHIRRLYADGGGLLSDGHATPEAARQAGLQDDENTRLANCVVNAKLTQRQKGELAGMLIRVAPEVAFEFLDNHPDLPASAVTGQLAVWLKDLPGNEWDVRLGPAPGYDS